jgi:hypothetical protein
MDTGAKSAYGSTKTTYSISQKKKTYSSTEIPFGLDEGFRQLNWKYGCLGSWKEVPSFMLQQLPDYLDQTVAKQTGWP